MKLYVKALLTVIALLCLISWIYRDDINKTRHRYQAYQSQSLLPDETMERRH